MFGERSYCVILVEVFIKAYEPKVLGKQQRIRFLDATTKDPIAKIKWHSETLSGESQNLFATLTVRTYVWIVQHWTLK